MRSWSPRLPGAQRSAGLLLHLGCVLALMWPALVNRQPFYFPDTTSYVRAADISVYLASGISTAWTARYRGGLAERPVEVPGARAAPAAPNGDPPAVNGNDVASGSIMSGRSPAFGVLLYVSYVLTDFWGFVAVQAVVAYALLRIAFRLNGFVRARQVLVAVLALAFLTTAAVVDSFLLADALAGFGLLAVLLLAIDGGRLSRRERWLLWSIMLVSAVSHLTHVLIFAALAVVLALVGLVRRERRRDAFRAASAAFIVAAAGLAAVAVTNVVVERHFGKPPVLVPLVTARFIGDGPGAAFIVARCPAAGFAICAFKDRMPATSTEILWSRDRARGVFLVAGPAARLAMSREDIRFGLAVLGAYPWRQGLSVIRNSWSQLTDFSVSIMNHGCAAARSDCWASLPPGERARVLASVGGRNGWPVGLLDLLYDAVCMAAMAVIAGHVIWRLAMRRGGAMSDLEFWGLLIVAAMLVNAVLGGAISEPQGRYQSRLIWLLPMVAGLLAARAWRGTSRAARPATGMVRP